ncbi:N-carbamoyl-L-amino acid hydrolase [Botrimarina colliarenosi]|uniref:N-carbamoyl-L-amino acid hydrolase n=1 Tax=Botrimarina colliarenosi TaxID=2528001 RepID=A0A5C6AFD3_9BACT|nr:allantoate amidohydrolase [Botrimarina colliarenosi]TWT97895.1 N-carbamoyl-L-amino acid hydrolase [Botrimarina colliarenosi]
MPVTATNSPPRLADLVMTRCDELAACSETPDCLTRRFLTTPMCDVHAHLRGWMEAAGLATRVDDAGNLVGRRESPGASQTLLIGSHLDTVPGGGRYDGVLGVLIGLAVAESLGDGELPFHLDVVGFSEEEGVRYSKPYLGSAAVAGVFQPEWLDRCDETGVPLREAISVFGLDPAKIAAAAYASDEVIGYVEPHLEQGPVLERADVPVGIVSGIVGQSRLRLRFVGEAGHAGTTPMAGRRDALVAAAAFVTGVRNATVSTEGLRATVGQLAVTPGAPNVIAERVDLSLDVRHANDAVRERAVDQIITSGRRIAEAERCRFEIVEKTAQGAVVVDESLTRSLTEAVADAGHEPIRLPSGAGHDAVIMAQRFPVAMLFVRHPGGVSHHPDERVDRDDVGVAIEVLTQFVRRVAGRVASDSAPVSSAR